MLLSFPLDHLTSVGILHPIHLDLLDDHVVATHRSDDLSALHAEALKQPQYGMRNETIVHDLAFNDGVRGQRAHSDPDHFRLIARVVDLHDLHET